MRKRKKAFADKNYEACLIEFNKADSRLASYTGHNPALIKFFKTQLNIAKENLERARKARYEK